MPIWSWMVDTRLYQTALLSNYSSAGSWCFAAWKSSGHLRYPLFQIWIQRQNSTNVRNLLRVVSFPDRFLVHTDARTWKITVVIKKWTVGMPGNEANYIWVVRLLLTVLSCNPHPSQRGRLQPLSGHQGTQFSNTGIYNKMLTSVNHIVT